MSKIAVITASTRGVRVGPYIAEWVYNTLASKGKTDESVELERLDITDFNLPVFDESLPPKMIEDKTKLAHEHSRKWSNAVAAYAGYVFVTPEYNASIPAGLKNAIDYLHQELLEKPAVVVSYGPQGGSDSSADLSRVLTAIGMTVSCTRPQLSFKGGRGPDAMAAVMQGKLGDGTKIEWDESGQDQEVLKAWVELKAALERPNSVVGP